MSAKKKTPAPRAKKGRAASAAVAPAWTKRKPATRTRNGRSRPRRTAEAPAWIQPGVLADYHAVIGGPVTKRNVVVRELPYRTPSASGQLVVFVSGITGYVAVEALTPATNDCAANNCPSAPPGGPPDVRVAASAEGVVISVRVRGQELRRALTRTGDGVAQGLWDRNPKRDWWQLLGEDSHDEAGLPERLADLEGAAIDVSDALAGELDRKSEDDA